MADQQLNISLNAIDNTKKAFNDLNNNLKGVDKQAQNTTASFFTFKNALIATAGVALIQLSRQIIETTTKFEDLRSNLISANGSIQDGANSFNYLKKYAKESQFSVEELTAAYLTLYQNGVTPTEKTLKTLASVAGESTNKIETLTQLVNLFSKGSQDANIGVMALGVLLRNNVPVYEILRTKVGGTTDSINGLFGSTTTAKIALDALLKGLEERAGKAADRTDNLSTRMKLFGKTVDDTLASFGETKAFNYFFDTLTQGFERNKPFLEFLGAVFIGILNVTTYILTKAIDAFSFFFDLFVNAYQIFKNIGTAISDYLSTPIKYASDKIDEFVKSFKKLKEMFGVGNTSTLSKANMNIQNTPMEMLAGGGLKEAKPIIDTSTTFEKSVKASQIELLKVLDTFDKIGQTIATGLASGIKDFSKGIAESIVLGKSLQTTFADIARNILVKIIAGLIEEQFIKLALIALDQIAGLLGLEKLYLLREQTKELREQAILKERMDSGKASPEEMAKKQLGNIFDTMWEKLKSTFGEIYDSISGIFDSMGGYVNQIFSDIGGSIGDILTNLSGSIGDIFSSIGGSLGDILSSVGNIFGGSGGGGGGFDLGTLIDIGTMLFAAEGGAITAGQPYVVGERGRELFIPSTNGTMIPNQDLGTTGGTSINFTINATDVRGVQELLINNRATITNLVNQALNQRGKSSIVWVEHFQAVQKLVQYL